MAALQSIVAVQSRVCGGQSTVSWIDVTPVNGPGHTNVTLVPLTGGTSVTVQPPTTAPAEFTRLDVAPTVPASKRARICDEPPAYCASPLSPAPPLSEVNRVVFPRIPVGNTLTFRDAPASAATRPSTAPRTAIVAPIFVAFIVLLL